MPARSLSAQPAGSLKRPLLALLVLSALLLTLAYQLPFDADWSNAGVVTSGFYGLEGRSTARPFRWTDGNAHVWFAGLGRQPYQVTLTLSGARAAGVDLPRVRVLANGQTLAAFTAPRPVQDFSFPIPAGALDASGDLDVRIESDTFVPPNDLRTLGITVYAVRLQPLVGARPLALPAPLALAWGTLAAALLFAALRAHGRSRRAAWPLCVMLVLALCAGVALARPLTIAALPWLLLAASAVFALAVRDPTPATQVPS